MEILVIAPAGYCIGKLFSQKISRNFYLKNQNLIFISKKLVFPDFREILYTLKSKYKHANLRELFKSM